MMNSCSEFEKFFSESSREINKALQTIEIAREEIEQNVAETIEVFESLLDKLKKHVRFQQTEHNDLLSIKNELNRILDELQQSVESVRAVKQEKREAKVRIDEMIIESKKDIERLMEENHRMESELNVLPPVLRLMSTAKSV